MVKETNRFTIFLVLFQTSRIILRIPLAFTLIQYILMHHTESKLGTPMSLKLRSIKNHLKERSFNSFITWRRRVCTIHDLSIFQSIVLATFTTAYSLDEFIEVLRRYSLRIKLSNEDLVVKFSRPQATDIVQKS